MKLHELKEMAIRGGDFRSLADSFAQRYKDYFENNKSEFKHIGDIETYYCYQNKSMIFLFDKDRMIFICSYDMSPHVKGAMKIDSVWMDKDYEGKKIYSKILWFLRSREGVTKLVLGDQHSDDTYKLLKAGGLSRFNKTWINTRTGEEENFSTENIDKFYAKASSDWKLVLESNEDGDSLTEDVKNFRYSFMTDVSFGYVNSAYDWQID